jgi:xanthine dehydrogenase molybdopterin-binding subunit B
MYTDDLVVPGAWYGATIRSTDAHARFLALDQDPDFDWSSVVLVTAADIPGENIVSSIKADQPVLVPIGGEIQHHAEPLALLAAGPRDFRRARAIWPRTSAPRDLHPLVSARDLHHRERRGRGGDGPRPVLEGEYRVGHQEQLTSRTTR